MLLSESCHFSSSGQLGFCCFGVFFSPVAEKFLLFGFPLVSTLIRSPRNIIYHKSQGSCFFPIAEVLVSSNASVSICLTTLFLQRTLDFRSFQSFLFIRESSMARESCNLDKDEAEILKPSSPSSASSVSPPPPSSSSSLTSTSPSLCPKPCEESTTQRHEQPTILPREVVTALSPKLKANSESSMRVRFRCSTCQRKVGLTGFRCRCGDLFCGRHRYSDVHDCSFDYKAFGRPEIAKANPLIRAAKIIKI